MGQFLDRTMGFLLFATDVTLQQSLLSHTCATGPRGTPSRLSRRRKLSSCYSLLWLGGWLFQESSSQEMLGCRLSRKVISLGPLRLHPFSKWSRRLWDTWRHLEASSQIPELIPSWTGWSAPALHVERGLQGNTSASPPWEKQSSGQRALSEIFAMKITIFPAAPGTAQGYVYVEALCQSPEFETSCFFSAF